MILGVTFQNVGFLESPFPQAGINFFQTSLAVVSGW